MYGGVPVFYGRRRFGYPELFSDLRPDYAEPHIELRLSATKVLYFIVNLGLVRGVTLRAQAVFSDLEPSPDSRDLELRVLSESRFGVARQ